MSTLFGDTTVVTECRTYVVDKRGRKSMGRAAVSARSQSITQQSVTVSRTQPHHIVKHPNKHLQIRTEFPVRAVLTQGAPEVEYPVDDTPQFTTAVIFAEDFQLNFDNQIAVYEPDSDAEEQIVTVFNATTGETETVTLARVSPSMYVGHLKVKAQVQVGTNFDGCLFADYGHNIKIHYRDVRTSSGSPATIIKSLGVLRAAPGPNLVVRPFAKDTSIVGIALIGAALDRAVVNVVNQRTNYSLQLNLEYSTGGMFGQFHVSDMQGGIEPDDILTTTFSWFDVYSVQQSVHGVTKIVTEYPQGVIVIPASVQHGKPVKVRVVDAELVGVNVGVVIVDLDTEQFERVRLLRVGENTGVYELEWLPSPEARTLEVRYTDGTVIAKVLTIDTPVVEPEVPGQTPTPQPTQKEYVPEIELIINGLFTLNGQFSGTIKLTAVEDESVGCTIIHAS